MVGSRGMGWRVCDDEWAKDGIGTVSVPVTLPFCTICGFKLAFNCIENSLTLRRTFSKLASMPRKLQQQSEESVQSFSKGRENFQQARTTSGSIL